MITMRDLILCCSCFCEKYSSIKDFSSTTASKIYSGNMMKCIWNRRASCLL